MRLLQSSDASEFSFTKDFVDDDTIPPYAILSHTWEEDEEITFQNLMDGTGQNKNGYKKIRFCAQQAEQDSLRYFWVDTCCINKADHVELQDAINSMFRWYQNAAKCYVYLSDVSTTKQKASDEVSELTWGPTFQVSRWFTRGWTLQELLAPTSVEFFSKEQKRLGDKQSLRQQIHKITGIPHLALQGAPLSQFSVNERLLWKENRQTKLEEDRAYSLLGIFGVYIAPIYGEGTGGAFKRLLDEISKLEKCIQDLRLTDPRDDKKRIEDTKGGLLEDSYRWILKNSDFQRWCVDQQSRLLWIKGDPGKGKTMLLCGIVNELEKSISKTHVLSYFFCQATDSRINNPTAVLRGLLYMLIKQQPSLVSHIRKKHDDAGKALFEDTNAWVAISEIFTSILQDSNLNKAYLVVDAVDECVADLPKLLDFIVQQSSVSSRVKWIISSRNWPEIEGRLESREHKARLCLELNNESVSTAVRIFIQHKVRQLAERKKYDDKTRDAVQTYLSFHADDTFLWVALVCQNLEKIPRWKAVAKLDAFPPGLDSLYERMIEQIYSSDDVDMCKQILALVAIVYRPITLKELTSLVEMLNDMIDDLASVREIIGCCGSFLVIREGTVFFVHLSAKDYLTSGRDQQVFGSTLTEEQGRITHSLLDAMYSALQRDMCRLQKPGVRIQEAITCIDTSVIPQIAYACEYWIDHLQICVESGKEILVDGGRVHKFFQEHLLHWLEAIGLLQKMPEAVAAMQKLHTLLSVSRESKQRNAAANLVM